MRVALFYHVSCSEFVRLRGALLSVYLSVYITFACFPFARVRSPAYIVHVQALWPDKNPVSTVFPEVYGVFLLETVCFFLFFFFRKEDTVMCAI